MCDCNLKHIPQIQISDTKSFCFSPAKFTQPLVKKRLDLFTGPAPRPGQMSVCLPICLSPSKSWHPCGLDICGQTSIPKITNLRTLFFAMFWQFWEFWYLFHFGVLWDYHSVCAIACIPWGIMVWWLWWSSSCFFTSTLFEKKTMYSISVTFWIFLYHGYYWQTSRGWVGCHMRTL